MKFCLLKTKLFIKKSINNLRKYKNCIWRKWKQLWKLLQSINFVDLFIKSWTDIKFSFKTFISNSSFKKATNLKLLLMTFIVIECELNATECSFQLFASFLAVLAVLLRVRSGWCKCNWTFKASYTASLHCPLMLRF